MNRHSCRVRALILCCEALFLAAAARGAQENGANLRAGSSGLQQGVYLVFPFQNAGASPRLDWLGEGLEELTIQYLSTAGQQVYSHAGRAAEFERNGLPFSARLSRASMLRIAQDLDADFVIFGSFASDGKSLTVESRVLRIDPIGLLPVVRESGPLESLMELHGKVVWRLLAGNGRPYWFTLAEFSKAQRPLRLDAFEHYIRGLLANEDEPRLRELREASRLEPSWPDLDPDEDDYPFNLGLLSMQSGDFVSAAAAFREASERKPENPEDRALLVQALEKAGKKAEADQERESAGESLGPNALQSVRL